ncbi:MULTISPECIES: alpha/beta fold hydrolase [unclassified Streptomyces]|uniref:alpha/beta fold hydrolase n=1 Tax=unclassified Streptomyces TaxID=2593676 RepID=UPI0004CA8560|nr:alpha/beta fold hydrolase [Streptomyces sp. NRRL F-2747]
MVERVIQGGGVRLCAESFGDPGHPAVLLVMGAGASMLWWDEGFCRTLAGGGRFVIRYDHRDTGRSLTYEPGRPGYTGADLVGDAARVLDAYGVLAAHVVGVSAGGALAQRFALGHTARVLSLVLISTSSAASGGGRVPAPPTAEFMRFVSTARADWSDAGSVAEYQVAFARLLAGGRRPFDEEAVRSLVRRDIGRAHDFAAARNHDLLPEGELSPAPPSSIAVPTLVIHGTADPMFPLPHGEALADEIPGARLLVLRDAGHGVERADWGAIVPAILEHTAAGHHP